MDIRVSASAVSDGRNVPYEWDSIPDPTEYRQFRADQAVLAQAGDSRIGRDGSLPLPKLRQGIRIKRGGAAVVIKGVDQSYVDILRADHTRIVEVIASEGEVEQVIDARPTASGTAGLGPDGKPQLGIGGGFADAPASAKKGHATK